MDRGIRLIPVSEDLVFKMVGEGNIGNLYVKVNDLVNGNIMESFSHVIHAPRLGGEFIERNNFYLIS